MTGNLTKFSPGWFFRFWIIVGVLSSGWSFAGASPAPAVELAAGFPRTEPGTIDFAGPAIVDLNNDGRMEVLVADSGGCVWGWDSQGNPLANFPLAPFGRCGARTRINSFAVGNIDDDPSLEIVAGTAGESAAAGQRGKVFAWNADGRPVPGWPREMTWNARYAAGQPEVYSVLLANIAGDQRLEVIAGTSNNASNGGGIDEPAPNVFAWSGGGGLLSGFPTSYRRAGVYGMLGAGDLNQDACMEVIAPRDHRWLHVYDSAGQYLRGWPVETWVDPNLRSGAPYVEFTRSAPALGDLDGDGQVELVMSGRVKQAESISGGQVVILNDAVMVYEPDGQRRRGWDVARLGDGPPLADTFGASQAPALADLDGDGRLEVVVTLMDGTARAYRRSGELLWKYDFARGARLAPSEAVIGDIDGDRQVEVVFGVYSPDGSANTSVGLLALDAAGRLKPGFPLALTHENNDKRGIRAAPALADLDGDGKVEIVAGSWSGVVYVWDTNAAYRAADMPWPTGRQNNQRTGYFNPAAAGQDADLTGAPDLDAAAAVMDMANALLLPVVRRPDPALDACR